ncbi:hypothetical protein N7462_006226 [Penicillium macrosclerotiorum]|uniref:uncharacterized protein n=1 Tax=Penicillium macrosclerotiorum TaxID=303699 RepID=UPI002546821B|nr:uncharacterized protein N7462_006226 [Penicillium macrosclerotiorum]KAJ5683061.1 hypothetical protein N7462_006226 [Penicillium macrosclerotiorum]
MVISCENVLKVASICRGGGVEPVWPWETGPVPLTTSRFLVWTVLYPDTDVKVTVRVPFTETMTTQSASNLVTHEAEFLKYLRQQGFEWSPCLLVHSAESNNALEWPYLITTWTEGTPLIWNDTFPSRREDREKVLQQVASIMFQLVTCTQEPSSTVTAEGFLMNMIDLKIIQTARGELNGGSAPTLLDCMVLRMLAHKVIDANCTSTAMSYSHENLISDSIIIDDNYNVKGFANWSFARRLPIRFSLRFPRFLTTEGKLLNAQAAVNPALVYSIYLCPSPTVRLDREFFVSRLQYEMATRATTTACGNLNPLGWEILAWDPLDVDWKHILVDAVLHHAIHVFIRRRQYLLPGTELARAGVPSVLSVNALYTELPLFFNQTRLFMPPGRRQAVLFHLLQAGIERRLPWDFMKMLLKEAFTVRSNEELAELYSR